jgi:hypothetical protein
LAADDPTIALLSAGIGKIVRAYQDDWQRSPQLRELLYAFLFVLRAEPEDYISGAEGFALQSLTTE